MILYHGSNVIVDCPKLIRQSRFLDFGFGFYTTTNREQAVNFAAKVTERRQSGEAILNTLYLTGVLTREQTIEDLKIRKLFNQLVFATEKALKYLQFKGRERL